MSELDVAKEQIAYLKLWLGIMVVTDISLIGWFIGNYEHASASLLVTDLLAVAVVSVGIMVLHDREDRAFEESIIMEYVAALLLIAVPVLFVYLALDATRLLR